MKETFPSNVFFTAAALLPLRFLLGDDFSCALQSGTLLYFVFAFSAKNASRYRERYATREASLLPLFYIVFFDQHVLSYHKNMVTWGGLWVMPLRQ